MYAFIGFEVFTIENGNDFSLTISFLFLGKMLLVLLLIYLIAVLTPKVAAKIDKASEKSKKKKPAEDERIYQVRSVFEPSPEDEKPEKTLFPEIKEMEKHHNSRNED